jgi:hypothetical protein
MLMYGCTGAKFLRMMMLRRALDPPVRKMFRRELDPPVIM